MASCLNLGTCFSTIFLLYCINDTGQWTYRSAQLVHATWCPLKGFCQTWNNKAEHKKTQYKCKVYVWGVGGKNGNKRHLSVNPCTDKVTAYCPMTVFLLQFTYHSRLPRTPQGSICRHNVLYMIFIILAQFIAAKIVPGSAVEKWYSFHCKECSIWFVCRTRQQEHFHPKKPSSGSENPTTSYNLMFLPAKLKEAILDTHLPSPREKNIRWEVVLVLKYYPERWRRELTAAILVIKLFKLIVSCFGINTLG